MQTHEVARLTGVSVRALHHYDAVGLLRPGRHISNGYRDYSEDDLDRLQQILLFRACGFSLEQIRRMLEDPMFDRGRAFQLQQKALLCEKARIEAMLGTLEKSIRSMKGEISMTAAEKFEGFDFSQNPYEKEARELWGDQAVDKSNAALEALSPDAKKALAEQMNELFRRLSNLRGEDPAGETAQKAMGELFRFFNDHFGNIYTPRAFTGLGNLYVADARFTQNIDRYGEGLAAFLSKAMGVFGERHAK